MTTYSVPLSEYKPQRLTSFPTVHKNTITINGLEHTIRGSREVLEAAESLIQSENVQDWWQYLEEVTKIFVLSEQQGDKELHLLMKSWLIYNADSFFGNYSSKKRIKNMSYNFALTIINVGDWGIVCKPVLRGMSAENVEKYLLKEIPKLRFIQQPDTLKQISKRKDSYGDYPLDWLIKIYGRKPR